MGKLRVLSGREVFQILARHGFIEVRKKGSLIIMQRKLSDGTITVPVPDHHEIRSEPYSPLFVSQIFLAQNLNNEIQNIAFRTGVRIRKEMVELNGIEPTTS